MSLKIRLARGGSKKRPFYSIVVADARAPRDGRFIEKIGFHNPMMPRDHAERLSINLDRAKYWMSVGAKPSPRVHRFLADAGVMEKASIPEQTKQHLPRAKEQERIREREQKAKKAKRKKQITDWCIGIGLGISVLSAVGLVIYVFYWLSKQG